METFHGGMSWSERLGFSQAVRVGDLVFVSGQPGVDEAGQIAGDGGITAQTAQAYANLDTVLRDAGSHLGLVVRTTTLLRDMNDLEKVVAVRMRTLSAPFPADTVYQVSSLARPEFLLEIDAIAVIDRAAD